MLNAHSVGIISHLDTGLADLLALSLITDNAEVFSCSILGLEQNEISNSLNQNKEPKILFTQYDLLEEKPYYEATIEDECITCALRVAIMNFLSMRIQRNERKSKLSGLINNSPIETFIILPKGIELSHLMPRLSDELEEKNIISLGTMHLINLESAKEDLLSHKSLEEMGVNLIENDQRCIAEVHQLNLGYTDTIVTIGDNKTVGRELIEHLRPHDVLLFDGLDTEILQEVRKIRHDPCEAIRRIHPATTQAWGGPCEYGTWTLDLYSDKPFNPERLKEFIGNLCIEGVYARGCFWLPTRPNDICSWEGIGEILSVGLVGNWNDIDTETGQPLAPHCHLILTGIGSEETAIQIKEAFAFLLFNEGEDMLAWVGKEDGLDDWFA